jgi:iron complex outermembrane receptor protein
MPTTNGDMSERGPSGSPQPRNFVVLVKGVAFLLFCLAVPSARGQQQAPVQHESVVVTGVYEPIPLAEADRPVTLVDTKDLELLSGSLVDFLRLESSVDLRERGSSGPQVDVSIRGGTFGQTLVLLDGFRMNDAQTGHHNMDLPLPLEAISRIEILRGSGSTVYGSDAVAGVINFVTRSPEFSEVRMRTAVGSFGINQQSISVTLAARKLTEHLAFSRDFSSGFQPDRDYRNLAFFSSTSISRSWGPTRLTLAHNDRPFGADQFYGNYNSREHTRTWFAGLHQGLGPATEFSLAFRRHTDLFVSRSP